MTPEDIGPGFLLTLDEKALLTKKDQSYVLYDLNNGDSRPMPAIPSEVTPLQWSVDGNSVYVMQPSVLPIRIHLLNLQTGQMKLWKEITPSDVAGIQVMGSFLLTRDGQAYVYTYRRVISDLYLAKGLQ